MKKFGVPLIFIGGCLLFLIVGFSLGQLSAFVTSPGFQIETRSMQIRVAFKPETSELEQDISAASLCYYLKVLTACLNEPENSEKINSTRILEGFISDSCLVNALRSRGEKHKSPSKRDSDAKHNL